jgi:hypothetical protein
MKELTTKDEVMVALIKAKHVKVCRSQTMKRRSITDEVISKKVSQTVCNQK